MMMSNTASKLILYPRTLPYNLILFDDPRGIDLESRKLFSLTRRDDESPLGNTPQLLSFRNTETRVQISF